MESQKFNLIKTVFWTLVGIFIILVCYFAIPVDMSAKRAIFLFMAVLAIFFFLLGGVLIFLTLKGKLDKKIKKYLLLTGISSAGFLISVILHNLIYGLSVISSHITVLHYLMEALHIAFFIIAIFVCPIGFLVGVIGGMIFFVKKQY